MERKDLTDIEQLGDITQNSDKTTVIFKHSVACPISSMMLKRFENGLSELDTSNIDYYFLDIFCYRHISNEIEKKFNVRHESPQLLVINNGQVNTHASHSDIAAEMIVA